MSLIRNLNEYMWTLSDKKVILTNKKLHTDFILDKVRLMSFMKFAPNCLDKMRIEESKRMRKSLKTRTEKGVVEREKLHEIIKNLKEKIFKLTHKEQLLLIANNYEKKEIK